MNKNIIIVVLVGLLLIGAVYLNIKSQSDEPSAEAEAPVSGVKVEAVDAPAAEEGQEQGYFESYKEERDALREKEIAYIDEVMAVSGSDDETLEQAQLQKLALVESMEKEFTIESLLVAKGFQDAAVSVHSGSVNVIINADALTAEEAAQVFDVVLRETGESASNIKVITNKE